ncbi:MAG: peptide chain release factor 1 [Proteobacteria bacterium]|nr:peptide chain release factor 1 [Pseudomonadota bacterium]
MIEQLKDIERRFFDLEDQLSQPGLSSDRLTQLSKEHADLSSIVKKYQQYRSYQEDLEVARELIGESDKESQSLGHAEVSLAQKAIQKLENELVVLLLPKDPNDEKNVFLEIRAGTGGEEAALFVADLTRMYQKFAEKKSWSFEVISQASSQNGGYKEVIYLVSGERVYSTLKHEVGVHRVQRVPLTESQGRLHTSACTVAVLPEREDIEIAIHPSDLEIKTCRSSGAGGQHLNKTDSAIRIVHLPTGVAVECQDERSQHKNKEKALKVLKSRLFEMEKQESEEAQSAHRRKQVGSGDRSQRIRTYNFPQGRITDHRLSLTLYKLAEVLEGNLSEIIDKLGAYHTAQLLKEHGHNEGS